MWILEQNELKTYNCDKGSCIYVGLSDNCIYMSKCSTDRPVLLGVYYSQERAIEEFKAINNAIESGIALYRIGINC